MKCKDGQVIADFTMRRFGVLMQLDRVVSLIEYRLGVFRVKILLD
jgi:hypothetical protein